MMRRFTRQAVALGLAIGALSCAAPLLGMDLVVDPGVNTRWAPGNWGQSFTADDGNIGSVGLLVANSSQAPTSVTLNLYDGEGTGGTLLKSQSVSIPASIYGYWADADVSNVAFTASSMYTISVTGSTSEKLCTSNSYAGGGAYYDGGAVTNSDLSFRVSSVPEPSALLLLGAGVVGLAGGRSFRRQG